MRSCPRCRRVFEVDEASGEAPPETCSACGTELVSTQAAAPIALPSYTELVMVYEAHDEADLGLVRALLEAADVPVFAWGEPFAAAAATDLAGGFTRRRLLVPVAFARKAREALRERGVVRPVAAAPADELASLWREVVAPLLAGPEATPLADLIALRGEAFRAALFGALAKAGPRAQALLADLALALALKGPREAAREAAGFLAAHEALRDRRAALVSSLGALVARGAEKDLAVRVVAALERFRGSPDAERALVPLLEHEDAEVRDAAIEALFSVSGGETLGYEPDAPLDARRAAVERWRERTGEERA